MSRYGLFFDSRGGDRVYNAASMEEWLRPFFLSGVFQSQLQVTATAGMTVQLASGYCNLNGKVRHFEDSQLFTLAAADATRNRVDCVVIERNDGDRDIYAKVLKGIPGEGAPARIWDEASGVYQLIVAEITVEAGATAITQADISDTRMNASKCGYVASTVTELDFTQISAQFNSWFRAFVTNINVWMAAYKSDLLNFESDATQQYLDWYGSFRTQGEQNFEAWLRNLQDQLDDNQAGHLQNQIDEINADIARLTEHGVVYDNVLDSDGESIQDGAGNPIKGTTIFIKLADLETNGGRWLNENE